MERSRPFTRCWTVWAKPMVPNVAGKGSSFRGAALYYLHDKRQEGERERLTTDRVAWAETRNLATDDPELAWRIMAATALDADRLKAQAGVRNTGRKSADSVYAYSIAWHPEEASRLSRAEMVRAANESILALGAHDRQAIIIAHRDEPHPHVHVMLNRVSPTDGRMLGTSNDFHKLEAWALAYRQARGEELKYCPARILKAEAARATKEGLKVDFERGAKSIPRSLIGDFAAAKVAANDNDARKEAARQSALSAKLTTDTKRMKEQHRAAWVKLSKDYQAKKAGIFESARTAKERAADQVKEQYRPAWRDLHRRQWKERQDFDSRERRLVGKINNALDAVAHRRELDPDSSRGFMAAAFNYLTSGKARAAAFEKLQKLEQRRLGTEQRQTLDRATGRISTDRSALLAGASKAFKADREALLVRTDEERQANRRAWSQRSEERTRAFERVRREGLARSGAKVQQESEPQERKTWRQRKSFNDASQNRDRGRSRSRQRTRTRGDEGGGDET